MQKRHFLALAGAVIAFIALTVVLVTRLRPRLSEEDVQERVVTTIQSEAKASFLVTGTLDIVATTYVENSRQLLPQILDLSLGTTRATIQVPGRAYYGFDVKSVKPSDIRLLPENVIEIDVPAPVAYSVEPNLHEMRVWTSKGWLRTAGSAQRAERRALRLINGALMRQAKTHLSSSMQPHINTADALKQLLTPTLKSMGVSDPKFRFRLGTRLVIEPD